MAPPKAVARSLRRSATRLSTITREVVAESAEFAIDRASNEQGRFFGGRYPLFAEVVERKENKKRTTVLVYPKPAAGWSIKSFGRGVSTGRPLLRIRGVGVRRGSAAATSGDGSWPRIQDAVFDEYGDRMDARVEEVLNDG